MAQKFYLVTGGTGFLGSALVRRLLKDGHRVRLFDNDSRGSIDTIGDILDQIEFVSGDIRDSATVRDAICGVDAVCHLAYINGTAFFYSKPELVLDVAIRGMLNVIDGCRAHNVRELIYASSSEVYQTPQIVPTDESVALSVPDVLNPRYSYGGGKILGELMAINYGRNGFDRVVIFRPHNVYGPQMGYEHVLPQFIMRMIAMGKNQSSTPMPFTIQGNGSETRAFTHVDDFIEGLMCVINKGKHLQIYHIGSADEMPIASVANQVAACLGIDIEVVPGELLKGSTQRRCPDITKLSALGFSAKIPFDQGLAPVVQWYKDNAHLAPVDSDVV